MPFYLNSSLDCLKLPVLGLKSRSITIWMLNIMERLVLVILDKPSRLFLIQVHPTFGCLLRNVDFPFHVIFIVLLINLNLLLIRKMELILEFNMVQDQSVDTGVMIKLILVD